MSAHVDPSGPCVVVLVMGAMHGPSSQFVAFAAATGVMPLDMPESVRVRFSGELLGREVAAAQATESTACPCRYLGCDDLDEEGLLRWDSQLRFQWEHVADANGQPHARRQ